MNIFGLNPVVRVRHATSRSARMLPPLIAGAREGLLRRHRAQCRARHRRDRDERGAARRPLCAHRRARCGSRRRRWRRRCCILARTTPRAGSRAPTGSRCSTPTLDRANVEVREIDKMGRKAVEFESALHRRARGAGRRLASARRAGASPTSSTASIPSACWSPPRRSASAAPRSPAPPPTPRSASCSAGRSARTRACSIRWRSAGSSSKRPS